MASAATEQQPGQQQPQRPNRLRALTRVAMLTALALLIFMVEAQFPPIIAIPGIKLGLANIVTLVALRLFSRREAAAILLLRILLGSIFAGQLVSLLYSLAGGLLCYLVMLPLTRHLPTRSLWVAGVAGAIAHNCGQMLVALALLRSMQLLWYLPFLIIAALIAGTLTGLCGQWLVQRYAKLRPNGS